MDINQAFGQNFKKIRKHKTISHENLATASGVSRTSISLIEKGERLPNLYSFLMLAKGLEVDPAELIEPLRKTCPKFFHKK